MSVKLFGLKEIQNTLKQIDENLYPEIIRLSTNDALENVERRAKKHLKSGEMQNHIANEIHKTFGEVFISNDAMMVEWKGKRVNYASFVLYGTRPHWIHPKEKKQLRYTSVKNFVHKQAVEHPGYKGDNFLHDGVQDTFKKLDKIINKVVENELK